MAISAKFIDGSSNVRTLRLDFGAAVTAKDVVVDRGNVLIAVVTALINVETTYAYWGKIEFDKQAALAIKANQVVYWNVAGLFATTDVVTDGVTNTKIGICVKDVAGAGTKVEAMLQPNVSETVLISIPIDAITANTTTIFGALSLGRALNIKRISLSAQVIPIDDDGTLLLEVKARDVSAPADDNLLASANFNMEGITAAQVSEDIPLTLVEADLQLAATDSIFFNIISDSAAISTPMQGGNITVEADVIG